MIPPHRVLVVGAGSIGERHVRCFAATGRARVALCETSATVRESVAERYTVADVYADYEAALDTKPDIVVIATPAHLHIAMATAAAKRGAHLLVEKPLGTSLDGVDELLRVIDERQVVAVVAYVYRCHAALVQMRAEIVGRRFGEPVQIVATSGQHFPLYRPAYRDIYYNDRATGGGAVQDALTHVMNAGQWLVGPVDRLVADLDHLALEGVAIEDTVHVIARHGGVMGSYSLNQHQAPNEMTITVVCTGGAARFEYHRSRWRWMAEPGGEWTNEYTGPLERDELFVRQAEAMLDAVEGKAPPPCSVVEARHALCINLAILSSAERRAWTIV